MQRFIARENIKRFRRQLENCTDRNQEAILRRLLSEEEAKLGMLESVNTDQAA
jgi:hypothetical protein